jgi:hypothetical protein
MQVALRDAGAVQLGLQHRQEHRELRLAATTGRTNSRNKRPFENQ